ncbi:hypothetical protein AAE478_002098 [Parahypoxylon ruwenzoriense]
MEEVTRRWVDDGFHYEAFVSENACKRWPSQEKQHTQDHKKHGNSGFESVARDEDSQKMEYRKDGWLVLEEHHEKGCIGNGF